MSSKMKIYVGHASSFNYKESLYQPLRNSDMWKNYEFILPHDFNQEPIRSKDIIDSCDAFIAEVSYSSTGLGIELAWADAVNCPIFCFAKKGTKPSSSISVICSAISWYRDQYSMLINLEEWLVRMK